MARQLLYAAVTCLAGGVCFFLCTWMAGSGVAAFLVQGGICAVVPNVIFAAVFGRSQEFRYFWGLVRNMVKRTA